MTRCFFVCDLHGKIPRYEKLFAQIRKEKPDVIFIGGDILPSQMIVQKPYNGVHENFITDFIAPELRKLRNELGNKYPHIYLILGNDDPRREETTVLELDAEGLWYYSHQKFYHHHGFDIFGYAHIPPTPFFLKDWERFDVSHFIDVGCISPLEGYHTTEFDYNEVDFFTIEKELTNLTKRHSDLSRAIFLFHTPPYDTYLDRAGLDGKVVDSVPVDVHVGSIALQRFIQDRQPYLTMHGHIHESARLTGHWQQKIGKTLCLSASHDGKELSLVRFELENPQNTTKELI
jgi:Icc-related predicted phosphoesterase